MRAGSTPNYATPQYSLTGGDYKQEAPAINQMFRNVQLESQYLQGQVGASGAAGNTMTTDTAQTVSGAKTFVSSITVGISAYTTTDTAKSALIGGQNDVAITTFTGVSLIEFYNLQSTSDYKAICHLTKHTADKLYAIADEDTGANYNSAGSYDLPTAGVGETYPGANVAHWTLTGPDTANANVKDGGRADLELEFGTVDQSSKMVWGFWRVVYLNNAVGVYATNNSGGNYNGASTFTNLRIYPASGTVDGRCRLERHITNGMAD